MGLTIKGVMMIKGKKFWKFQAKEDGVGELFLYGEISSYSWWGDEVTPKQFKADLDALGDVTQINVYINSEGGDVFAGQAIYSMLKRHSATINVYVDGLAASIASVIAMAGDTVYMPKNAMMMVHNPWTIAMGTAEDFRQLADDMDKIRESIITVYNDKSGMEENKIIELMDAETWMTAEEAVEYGFADEIEEDKQIAALIKNGELFINGQKIDLSKYRNTPQFPKTSEYPELRKRAQALIKALEEEEGEALEDWLYLIHHVHVTETGEEILHHCRLVDHLGNLYEIEHIEDKNGETKHYIKGLVADQDVYWSDEEAEADGQEVPCANRQLEGD